MILNLYKYTERKIHYFMIKYNMEKLLLIMMVLMEKIKNITLINPHNITYSLEHISNYGRFYH
jgi:hypothetical protein